MGYLIRFTTVAARSAASERDADALAAGDGEAADTARGPRRGRAAQFISRGPARQLLERTRRGRDRPGDATGIRHGRRQRDRFVDDKGLAASQAFERRVDADQARETEANGADLAGRDLHGAASARACEPFGARGRAGDRDSSAPRSRSAHARTPLGRPCPPACLSPGTARRPTRRRDRGSSRPPARARWCMRSSPMA